MAALIFLFRDSVNRKPELLWGSSYISCFLSNYSKVNLSGQKSVRPEHNLRLRYITVMARFMAGVTSVAEAYCNFGTPGVVIIMAGCRIFLLVELLRYRNLAGILFALKLIQEAINVNRIDFRYLYQESFFNVGAAALALFCISFLQWWLLPARHDVSTMKLRLVADTEVYER